MAERKIVIYGLDPENPEERKKLGTFELGDDGKVEADIDNVGLEWDVRQGLYDAQGEKDKRGTRLVGLDGGERFMELLAEKYGQSSFIAVETD